MIEKGISYFKQFDISVSANSFALFRILYALYNLGLIWQLQHNWPFYFDSIAPYSYSVLPAKLIIFLWFISNLFIAVGFFTRFAAMANYVLAILLTSIFANANISSFNDDLLRIGGFLLIFLPVAQAFSVDAIIKRLTLNGRSTKTSQLYYLLSILITIGLLYFSSGITKICSPMWLKGIGLWIPAVIPSYRWINFDFWVDIKWLMYSLNYFVIAFEILFPFLIFAKRFRPFIVITGIGMHLGIALLFPFTYISFGPIIYYSLFIPDKFWKSLTLFSKKTLVITYNPSNIKHNQAVLFLSSFNYGNQYSFMPTNDILSITNHTQTNWQVIETAFKKSIFLFPLSLVVSTNVFQNLLHFISENFIPTKPQTVYNYNQTNNFNRFVFFTFVVALCVIQFLTVSYHTYTAIKADKSKSAMHYKKRLATQDFSTKPSNLARTFFGINSRGVFLDHAFTGNKTVFSIALKNADGSELWLPIFTKEGYCASENRNLGWHKLSFKFLGKTKMQPDTLGLLKYTYLWAKKNNLNINDLEFTVYRKIYPCATDYEKGYLTKMLALPWDTMGTIHWKDSVFTYQNLLPDKVFSH